MPNPRTGDVPGQFSKPNAEAKVSITRGDLPLHCPLPGSSLWNSHPRVFLPIEDAPDKRITCHYCSTVYTLTDE